MTKAPPVCKTGEIDDRCRPSAFFQGIKWSAAASQSISVSDRASTGSNIRIKVW